MKLPAAPDDDHAFLTHVELVLNGAIRVYRPDALYLVRIADWFDYKWRAFQGSRDHWPRWDARLVPPPFAPKRVTSQRAYQRSETCPDTFVPHNKPPLHRQQPSARNADVHRHLRTVTPNGLYLWYSGNTKTLDRGCLMVYAIQPDVSVDWYVSLRRADDWTVGRLQGISPRELGHIRSAGATVRDPATTLSGEEAHAKDQG